ncbi:MAG: hypothetical protein B6D56_02865 [Candidatus Omnitrophica bacterium 4484_70.1]|nr:MAG: hypothetical protein B6D56_02865 [Candidatus Omnitrophica bacterium 4484_70.1]
MKNIVYLIICPPCWIKTPALGLEFIKSYLMKRNKNLVVKILDLNILFYKLFKVDKKRWLKLDKRWEEELFFIIEKKFPYILENLLKKIEKAVLVGFSLFRRNCKFSFQLISRVKEKYPTKKIAIGGPHVLFMKLHKKNLSREFFWVVGEGEIALNLILNGASPRILEYKEIENLDEIPFLEFNDYPVKSFYSVLPLYSSRGCPYKCLFCTERLLTRKIRQHSPLYVVEQIKMLKERYKISTFSFQDSLININIEWLENFCSLLLKNNLKIKWEAQIRIDNHIDENLAQLIKKAGCFDIFVGLESACDKILEKMGKGFCKDEALRFFHTLRKAELHFETSLILGYPGENEKDFRETVDFIIQNKKIIPKIAQINPYINYFVDPPHVSKIGIERVHHLVNILQKERIPFTKSFINNLFYEN